MGDNPYSLIASIMFLPCKDVLHGLDICFFTSSKSTSFAFALTFPVGDTITLAFYKALCSSSTDHSFSSLYMHFSLMISKHFFGKDDVLSNKVFSVLSLLANSLMSSIKSK